MPYLTDAPLLLHIPKTGGTSLRQSWGLRWPEYQWHLVPECLGRFTFRYCFVRNPFDRAVSLWHESNKLLGDFDAWVAGGMPHLGPPRSHRSRVDLNAPAFHWARHAHWVGRFENRVEDLEALCAILGRRFPERHDRKADRDRPGYRAYYGRQQTIDRIAELWRDDLDVYGYEY